MPRPYSYSITQCDVPPERRQSLESFRGKRQLWLSWIDTDEHHAIWPAIHSMVWTDATFKALTGLAVGDEGNALNNPLLVEALLNGHVATQILTIRRLVDRTGGTISLRRLMTDLRTHFALFTRENCVCFDGLPYDYHATRLASREERIKVSQGRGIWVPTTGPEADGSSELAHRQFDRLTGIDPANRRREDRLPRSLLATIEQWLDDSSADELASWSHAFLAHAGGPEKRKQVEHLLVTADRITEAIKALARVTEAISLWLLFEGGRTNALMPVAQFNPFDKLDRPIMPAGGEEVAWAQWHKIREERDRYLEGVDCELIGPPLAGSKA